MQRKTPLRVKRDLRRYSGKPKRCQCGREFMPRTIGQRWCSHKCAQRFRERDGKVTRRCGHCGAEFETYRSEVARGYGRYCSRRCAGLAKPGKPPMVSGGPAHPAYKHGRTCRPTPVVNRKRFKSGQRSCQHPAHAGRCRGAEHHVVYEQEVRRRKGDVSDPRNALRLCGSCHASHHHRTRPVPLMALRDANYEFAFELMGSAAFVYLSRRYSGDDPRLHRWLERVKAAAATGGDQTTRGGSNGEGR